MIKATFNVTYEIVTPESAEDGDCEESGFIGEGLSLRDAVKELYRTRTNMVDGIQAIECDSAPCVRPRWITVVNGMEFETGANESRSLHINRFVSASSARRIARLVGATLR